MDFIDPISEPELPPAPPIDLSSQPESRDRTLPDLLDVLFIVAVAVLALFFCSLAAGIVYRIAHGFQHLSPEALNRAFSQATPYLIALQLAAYLMIVGFMALLARGRHAATLPEAVSWNTPSLRRLWYAFAGGLALALFSEVGSVFLSRWIPKELPITQLFRDRTSALLLSAFGVLVAPLVEELFFRGFLYPALARFIGSFRRAGREQLSAGPAGATISVLITAALFTLLHGTQLGYSWAPLLLIFVVGVVLTVVRAATGSVATCVMVHMSYNFALMAQTFAATHGFRNLQGV